MKFYLVTLYNNQYDMERDYIVHAVSRKGIRAVLDTYDNSSEETITFVEEIAQDQLPSDLHVLTVNTNDYERLSDKVYEEKVKAYNAEVKLGNVQALRNLVYIIGAWVMVLMAVGWCSSNIQKEELQEKYDKQVQYTKIFHNYIKEKLPISYEKDFGGKE